MKRNRMVVSDIFYKFKIKIMKLIQNGLDDNRNQTD